MGLLVFLLEIWHLSQFPSLSKSRNTEGRDAGSIYAGEENSLWSNLQLHPEEETFAAAEVLKGRKPGSESWN